MTKAKQVPGPSPSRAVFGFALYLSCRTAFCLYLIWALVPDYYLHTCGLTIFPQKYWTLALPIHLSFSILLLGILFYPGLNMTLSPNWTSVYSFRDRYSRKPKKISTDIVQDDYSTPIPSVTDLDIREVCRTLYLHERGEEERPRKINFNRSRHRIS